MSLIIFSSRKKNNNGQIWLIWAGPVVKLKTIETPMKNKNYILICNFMGKIGIQILITTFT